MFREAKSGAELAQYRTEAGTHLRQMLPDLVTELRGDVLAEGMEINLYRISGVIQFLQAIEAKVNGAECDCAKCTAWVHITQMGVELIQTLFGADHDLDEDELVRLRTVTEFIVATLTTAEMVKAITTQRIKERRGGAALAALLGALSGGAESPADPREMLRKELSGGPGVMVVDVDALLKSEPETEPETDPTL